MKNLLYSFALLFLLYLGCSGATAHAQWSQLSYEEDPGPNSIGVGLGYLGGNSTYRINASDASTGQAVTSELRFPLQLFTGGITASYSTQNDANRDAFCLNLQVFTSLSPGTGTLQDSDWLNDAADIAAVGAAHEGRDLYSESDIEASGAWADLRMAYLIWPQSSFGAGPLAGFLYQDFRFTASNLHQTGYGPYAATYTGDVSGKVIDYTINYRIPFAGIRTELSGSPDFRLTVDLGYSPYATGDDKDDHVLRAKLSRGSAAGQAVLGSATAQWTGEGSAYLDIACSYLAISATGHQTQTWYASMPGEPAAGTVITGVAEKITSQQFTASITIGARF